MTEARLLFSCFGYNPTPNRRQMFSIIALRMRIAAWKENAEKRGRRAAFWVRLHSSCLFSQTYALFCRPWMWITHTKAEFSHVDRNASCCDAGLTDICCGCVVSPRVRLRTQVPVRMHWKRWRWGFPWVQVWRRSPIFKCGELFFFWCGTELFLAWSIVLVTIIFGQGSYSIVSGTKNPSVIWGLFIFHMWMEYFRTI